MFEESIARNLSKRKVSYDYEPHDISYVTVRQYRPDFILSNGIIIEAKGYFRSADQRKHKLIKEQHPELDIRFVFTNLYAKLYKGSKTTYAQWCEKNNFLASHRIIPKEWLTEKGKEIKLSVIRLKTPRKDT